MTLYPDGYGTAMITLDQMRARHGARMHPEFSRRFFAYIEAKGGLLGVGGGWRAISQISAASAAGRSFHQDQTFASGFVGYAAVDLVTTDGPDANNTNDGVTWAMTADAPTWGLHTFIKVPNEPWHIQCVEMRGYQTWVNAGRPDPGTFTLPSDVPPVVIPPPITNPSPPSTQENDEMLTAIAAIYAPEPVVTAAVPGAKTFMLLPDGSTEHASGPDVEYAAWAKIPTFPIRGVEHYNQIEARSQK